MKQHHLTQTLLQWLLLGFIAAPLLAGCNDSDDKGNPDPTPNPPAAVTFTVTLGVYDQQGVSAKVVPSDETASWYCNLFETAALGDLSDTTISELLEGIKETAPICIPERRSSPSRRSSPPARSTGSLLPATTPPRVSRATMR